MKYLLLSLGIIINRGQFTPGKGKTDIIYCCRDHSLRQNPSNDQKTSGIDVSMIPVVLPIKSKACCRRGGPPKLSLTMYVFWGVLIIFEPPSSNSGNGS
jgi:hypothetical protein